MSVFTETELTIIWKALEKTTAPQDLLDKIREEKEKIIKKPARISTWDPWVGRR